MSIRVLQVIPSLEKGGAEKMVLEISKHLALRLGINVLIVTLHDKNEYPDLSKGLNIIYCKSLIKTSVFKRSIIDVSGFETIVRDYSPDIIHSHLYEAEILSRWNVFQNIKYISHIHNNYLQIKKLPFISLMQKKTLANYYERKIIVRNYRKCDNHFIAVSNDSISFLEKNLPKDIKNLNFMPNAIDFSSFNRNIRSRNIEKSKVIRLINVGSLINEKNQIFLLDVVRTLLNRGFNVVLNIAGYGPLEKVIIEMIDQKGLNNYIFLKGRIDNIEEWYQNSDIYIHSSISESFSLTMLEANASGLPVVCLDAGGNRDILKEGFNGFMIAKPNAEIFAEKIIQLISNPDLYQTISENAIRFAANYNIGEYVNRLVDFYNDILKNNSKSL